MRSRHSQVIFGALVAVLMSSMAFLSSSCMIPQKTSVMAKIKGLNLTAQELRLKVNEFVIVFSGTVEFYADQIIQNSSSPVVRERALMWKSNAIPVSQLAAFQFDPLVGLLDVWAFSSQMRQFFESGYGRELFGNQQFIAIRASRQLENDVTHFVESLGPSIDLERAKNFVEDWVKRNPIQNLLFVRRSTNVSLASLAAEEKGIGEVLGGMEERINAMSGRMNILAQQMPKIGRWQGELLITDQMRYPPSFLDSKELKKEMDSFLQSFRQVSQLAPQLPTLIENQRVAITKDIQFLTQKTLNDFQSRTQQTLETASQKAEGLIDYAFVRLLILLSVLAVILFVFALLRRSKSKIIVHKNTNP